MGKSLMEIQDRITRNIRRLGPATERQLAEALHMTSAGERNAVAKACRVMLDDGALVVSGHTHDRSSTPIFAVSEEKEVIGMKKGKGGKGGKGKKPC